MEMRLRITGSRSRRRFGAAAIAVFVFLSAGLASAQTAPDAAQAAPAAPPRLTATQEMQAIQAASERDHRRMMDLLRIKALRPGEEKDANWDLAKADQHPNLPDPLVEKSEGA